MKEIFQLVCREYKLDGETVDLSLGWSDSPIELRDHAANYDITAEPLPPAGMPCHRTVLIRSWYLVDGMNPRDDVIIKDADINVKELENKPYVTKGLVLDFKASDYAKSAEEAQEDYAAGVWKDESGNGNDAVPAESTEPTTKVIALQDYREPWDEDDEPKKCNCSQECDECDFHPCEDLDTREDMGERIGEVRVGQIGVDEYIVEKQKENVPKWHCGGCDEDVIYDMSQVYVGQAYTWLECPHCKTINVLGMK